jgi:hypothetical protein
MKMKKKLLLIAAILVVAALAALIIMTPRIDPDPPLPTPNGYDDFAKAMTLVSGDASDWPEFSVEELRSVAGTNQAALELVRVGLTKQCRMPPWEVNATNGAHLDDLAECKRIAHAFAAASRLALIEGRTNEAALLALDCIRYGNESARGGVLIDHLVGIAIKAIGLSSLRDSAAGLDVENAEKAITALEAVAVHREPYDEIMQRERQWARRGRFGNPGIFAQIIQPFLDRKSLARARQKFDKSQADIRRMQIRLAIHSYELDHHQPPASMNDLVPQYLQAAPTDPETGRELPLN